MVSESDVYCSTECQKLLAGDVIERALKDPNSKLLDFCLSNSTHALRKLKARLTRMSIVEGGVPSWLISQDVKNKLVRLGKELLIACRLPGGFPIQDDGS
ncbi:hypothetical protein WG66_000131 [Moniliophthora roreri]|nr:hypothetical protein WG66_000131 [Moniliophthora roreri]